MRIEITLKNYRCFADRHPARIVIENGLIAFVGVNNAGKSTLLRFLYEFRQFFQHWTNDAHWRDAYDGMARGFSFPAPVRDPAELHADSNDRPLTLEFRASGVQGWPPSSAADAEAVEFQASREQPNAFQLSGITHPLQKRLPLQKGPALENNCIFVQNNIRVCLRNYVEAMRRLSRTLYVGAFRNVLNTGANQNYFDIQVGDAFIKKWRALQTGNSKHENRACLTVEAKVAELLGYRSYQVGLIRSALVSSQAAQRSPLVTRPMVTDRPNLVSLVIQAADSNDTLQVIADGRVYKLHELGSGMAQCVLVLVNAAVAKPGYILIDEPELHLHPSLQLDFLTALGELAEYGTLFSTHSIGLARAAADRIYSVVRQDGVSQVKELENLRNLPEFLGALSYSSYHALGFDKVLLVEGTTEVLALQRLLRKVGKEHRILLLPLGGSALINAGREAELNEVKRITANVSAVIDSEKDSSTASLSPDREAFRKSCAKLDIACHVLDRRAVENYLTERAIRQVKGDKYRALAAYEKLTAANPSWGKNENWRIIGEMSWDDVKDTDLGQFLAKL